MLRDGAWNSVQVGLAERSQGTTTSTHLRPPYLCLPGQTIATLWEHCDHARGNKCQSPDTVLGR